MQPKELDIKDKKILLCLDMDARVPESRIAKSVGLSKQLLGYRIKRLEKNDVIKGYYPVVDHFLLGEKLYRIAIKLENTTKEKETEILEFLKRRASWITTVFGEWDIWMALYAKDEQEFMSFWNVFYEKYSYYLQDRWISVMTKFLNFERSFIYPKGKNRNKIMTVGTNKEDVKVDETDRQIIEILTTNARQSSLEIARKIKKTERITRYRIKKLEDNKVILGYRTFLDTELLGYRYYKLFISLKDAKAADITRIRTHITLNPYAVYNTEAVGGYDFEIEAHFKGTDELYKFVSELKEGFAGMIKMVKHMEYIKEHKVSFY